MPCPQRNINPEANTPSWMCPSSPGAWRSVPGWATFSRGPCPIGGEPHRSFSSVPCLRGPLFGAWMPARLPVRPPLGPRPRLHMSLHFEGRPSAEYIHRDTNAGGSIRWPRNGHASTMHGALNVIRQLPVQRLHGRNGRCLPLAYITRQWHPSPEIGMGT